MHSYAMPVTVTDRIIRRMGKRTALDRIEATRTALIVIDMQNYFCAEGFPAEVPLARKIVPNINRTASAVRTVGGVVVWVQTTATGALAHWANYQTRMLAPDRQKSRLAGLDESSKGYELFPALEVLPDDKRVRKIKYSAFIPHSSDLHQQLRSLGIDTLLIAGTLTNVCCEATARDAMMLDYKVVMLADANATMTDEEHGAALNTFAMFFGDVMTSDEAIGRLTPAAYQPMASPPTP